MLTDSPGGNYNPGVNHSANLDQPLDLTVAAIAVLRIRTRWDIEVGYDFALAEVSADSGSTWIALPGDFTRPGHGVSGNYSGGTQPSGIPGHDGSKRLWADEEFDLTAYAGENDLRLRFRITSDSGLQNDGWLIDEVTVDSYPELVPSVAWESTPAVQAPVLAVSPNPFRSRSRISFTLPGAGDYAISIFDISGREVNRLSEGFSNAGKMTLAWNGLAGNGVPVASGTYFVRLITEDYSTSTKLIVVR
jgi:hypothetical protein